MSLLRPADHRCVIAMAWAAALLHPQPGFAGAASDQEPLVILTVDTEYLQSAMPLYTSIGEQAQQALAGANAQRRSDIELARELRQSEVLTALPEAIAEVARSADADLVLDRAVAQRVGEAGARDVTADVERILVAQFSKLPLEPGS